MTPRFLLLSLGFTACAPGSISWSTGSDALRTAFFDEIEEGGALALVLSNGQFDCELVESDDPSEIVTQLAELGTAACREDARHVTARLVTDRDSWVGAFPGAPPGGAGASRWAEGRYTGIEEAVATGNTESAIIYEPTELVEADLDSQSEVIIDSFDAQRLRGTVRIGSVGVLARFDATRCTGDATLFNNIRDALSAFCDL